MARSGETGRRRAALGLLALGGVGLVSGCATTQQEAARLQLNSARIRVAETHTVVRAPGRRVRVDAVSLVRHTSRSAFVVTVANPGRGAVADLPISVGVRGAHGARRYLNQSSTQVFSAYFGDHLPAIAPGRRLTWVVVVPVRLGAHARPFALVGDRADPVVSATGGSGPAIAVRELHRASDGRDLTSVRLALRNPSGVPQYEMPVYAVARRAGRVVAAGATIVPHLGTHRTEQLTVRVLGPLDRASLSLTARPTLSH